MRAIDIRDERSRSPRMRPFKFLRRNTSHRSSVAAHFVLASAVPRIGW